ncbi:MAG: protein kinase, partial [Gemmatimonadetes bacterium]|nr:protein kinase [Gemmatimonadota bacterium]
MTVDVAQLQDRLQAALGPHYRLERSLGQGGMGVVFLARDLTLDRQVAVKVVHPELAIHSSITQRFLSEARVIAKLRHPNIVAVHAAGEATGVFWDVMDYVPGETLRDRLNREGTVPAGAAQRIVAELADALDAAGRQGVVHRDVKPENILLDAESGRALLVDFGVARILQVAGDSQASITGQGVAVGTPTYMSPEQASGDNVDIRSDLYSLGIVAYEILTGQPPFRGSPPQVAAQQIRVVPTPLSRSMPSLAPAFAAAVMRALAKSPADRFQTGAEFRDALLTGRIAPLRTGRSTWLGWAAVAAVVLITVGIFFAARNAGGPPRGVDPRHSIVILPFDNLRGDTTLHWLEEGSVSMLGLTLAQWKDMTVVDQERVHDLLTKRGLEAGAPIGLEAARDIARGDVRPAFDRLAAQLLNVSGAPGGMRAGLADATTGSVDAYRDYLTGIDRLNHWDLVGADSVLHTAVATDSTFALAWFKLALTRGWIGGSADSLGHTAIERAVRYVDRLPSREQTLVRAYQAFLDGDHPRAVELYTTLVRKDSTDTDAWYGLGDAWYHRPAQGTADRVHAMNASLHAFRRALALDPTYALAYDHVAAMFQQTARPHQYFALAGTDSFAATPELDPRARAVAVSRARREGIALARDWVANQPETPRAHWALVEAYAAAGAVDEADRELTRLGGMGVPKEAVLGRISEGRIAFGAGDVTGAVAALTPTYDSLLEDRTRLDRAAAEDWMMLFSGANALAYVGDVGRAARAIAGIQ